MPACHPKAEKLRISRDNLKPKRENRMLTHQMELELRKFYGKSFQRPMASCNQLQAIAWLNQLKAVVANS